MTAPDWQAIEGEYRAGKKSVRAIAEDYGTSESTIRSRAKKHGWVRDPAGQQREKVKAHFSGVAQGVAQVTLREIEAATARAIAFEDLALCNAELALARIHETLAADAAIESADLKRLTESNKINLDVGRAIFSLNETGDRPAVSYDDAPFPDPAA